MGRKNRNANKRRKYAIKRNMHFLFAPEPELTDEFTVVRYLGEQDGDLLYVYHPEGYAFWAHVGSLTLPMRTKVGA